MSAATIVRRRDSRSSSGAKNSPTMTVGSHCADPGTGVGPVLDVDDERHGREQRADRRAERGEEEQAEAARPADDPELPAHATH
jgi:hypothetical protein